MNTKNILLEVYKEILTEAINADEIKKFITSRTLGASMYEILSHLNIKPSSPPNSQQVGAFLAVKRLLNKGELERNKVGKSFVYSKPKAGARPSQPTTPQSKPATAKVINTAANTKSLDKVKNNTQKLDKVIEKINTYLTTYNYKEKVSKYAREYYWEVALPDPKTGTRQWGSPIIKYYFDGINKGKLTLTPHNSAEVGLTTENLKSVLPPKKTKGQKNKEIQAEQLLTRATSVINSAWPQSGTWQFEYKGREGEMIYHLSTNDRGPRTDHGGGDDGDGWMSSGQIRRAALPYEKKWNPILKNFKAKLRERGIKVTNYDVEYGEKGHIGLNLTVGKVSRNLK